MAKLTDEQLADAASRYLSIPSNLNELGARYGVSGSYLAAQFRALGLPIRGTGHYAAPRLNEYATPATLRCTACKRSREEGARFSSRKRDGKFQALCNQCKYILYGKRQTEAT